jgi:hypothetical protein
MNLRKDSLSDNAPARRQAELQLDFIIVGGSMHLLNSLIVFYNTNGSC